MQNYFLDLFVTKCYICTTLNQKEKMRNKILSGHVIDRLKDIPAESVQTIVTSPPYWGLRNYGTEPQIWGGDSSCAHQWSATPPRRRRSENDVVDQKSKQATSAGTQHDLKATDTCLICGAWKGELGAEPTIKMFVDHLVEVFRECKRVLRDDGTLWVNMGDSYAGGKGQSGQGSSEYQGERASRGESINQHYHNIGGKGTTRPGDNVKMLALDKIKPKDLCLIPARMAIALCDDGWYVRSEIYWNKPNPMPESVTDRPTKSHEMIYLLTKKPHYFYDNEAIKEPVSESYANDKRPHGILRQHFYENSKYVKAGMMDKYEGEFPTDERDATRNKRDVWTIATQSYPGAYFATFPEAIPEICIKAGTSERGQCQECGKPLERIMEKSKSFESGSGKSGNKIIGKNGEGLQGGGDTGDIRKRPTTTTTGWKKSCKCSTEETVSQIVLDPFGVQIMCDVAVLCSRRSPE
jgi:DNA modification methylase